MEKSNLEKQQSGVFYNPNDSKIIALQLKSREQMKLFNEEQDRDKRFKIMQDWFKEIGEKSYIEPMFFCDFGCNLSLGTNVYMNTNCTILDSAQVKIGDNTMLGPNVQICTPFHSLIPEERMKDEMECAKPINIGKNCWIGAGVIILSGVTIGDGTTIGAGSVVTKDIPARSVAYGSPCKVVKNV